MPYCPFQKRAGEWGEFRPAKASGIGTRDRVSCLQKKRSEFELFTQIFFYILLKCQSITAVCLDSPTAIEISLLDLSFIAGQRTKNFVKKYDVLIRNDNLKVSSIHTRICCEHWEGGQKLSRTHLPSIFPWTESKQPRRVISKASQEAIDKYKRKRKNPNNNDEMFMDIEALEPATDFECATQTDLACFCNAQIEVKQLQDERKQLEEENLCMKSELKRITNALKTVKMKLTRLQPKPNEVRY